jgi:hypothetical protein
MTEDTRFIKLTYIPYKNKVLYEKDANLCIIRVKDIKFVYKSSIWDDGASEYVEVTFIILDDTPTAVCVTESVESVYNKIEEINNKDRMI